MMELVTGECLGLGVHLVSLWCGGMDGDHRLRSYQLRSFHFPIPLARLDHRQCRSH